MLIRISEIVKGFFINIIIIVLYVRSEFMSVRNGHMSDRNIWYTKYNHCKYALVTKNVNDFSSGEKN